MEMRVEQLSVRSGVAVDTIRYYQSKGLLDPPRREGRVAWYDDGHLERLARIRSLQQRGFTLATIVRLVTGELDAADEALLGELSGLADRRRAPRSATRRPIRPRGRTEPTPVAGSGRVRRTGCSPSPSSPPRPVSPWPCSRRSRPRGCSSPAGSAARTATPSRGRGRGPGRAAAAGVGHPAARPCSTWPAATTRPPRRWPGRRWPVLHPRAGPAPPGRTGPDRAGVRPGVRSGRGRVPDDRSPAPGLRGAPPGGEHPGRAPLHPGAREGGPRPRRTGRHPTRSGGPSGTDRRSSGDRWPVAARSPDDGPTVRDGAARCPATRHRPPTIGATRPRLDLAARAAEADLPTGPEKTELVRSMFDAIAPRYDLVNRLMTFGLDIRWRRQSTRALGLPAGAARPRPGLWDRRLPRPSSPSAGLAPLGMDLSWGMLAANRAGRPLAQADGAALPAGHRLGGRDHLRLRPPQLHRTRGRCSTSSAGWSGPAGGSACSRWPSPTAAPLLVGHRIWFRRVVPVIGGLVSDRAAYRYLPRSTAYLPADRRAAGHARRRPDSRRSTTGRCRVA